MYTVLNVCCFDTVVCTEQLYSCRHKFVRNVISSIVFMSTLLIHAFSAVCKVAAGHRMVTEGWTLFERTCEEVGPGELPQLLRQLKSATTPTPASPGPSTPVKEEPMEEEEIEQLADLGASGSGFIETPIMIKLGPQRIYIQVWELRHCPKDKTCNGCTHL